MCHNRLFHAKTVNVCTDPHDFVEAPQVFNGEGGNIFCFFSRAESPVHLVELQEPDGRHDARQVQEHTGAEPVANTTLQTGGQPEQMFVPV